MKSELRKIKEDIKRELAPFSRKKTTKVSNTRATVVYDLNEAINGTIMVTPATNTVTNFITSPNGPLIGIQSVIVQSVGSVYTSPSSTVFKLQTINLSWSLNNNKGSTSVPLLLDENTKTFQINTPNWTATPGATISITSTQGSNPFYVSFKPYSVSQCDANIVMNPLANYLTTPTTANTCGDSTLYQFAGYDGAPRVRNVTIQTLTGSPLSNYTMDVKIVKPSGDEIWVPLNTNAYGNMTLLLDVSDLQRGGLISFTSATSLPGLRFMFY